MTFGEGAGEQTRETSFLVVPITLVYNCMLGRPTLVALDAVTSIYYRSGYRQQMVQGLPEARVLDVAQNEMHNTKTERKGVRTK